MEKDDHSDKALFFIHGISKGQYDENIPDTYVHIPPDQLSGGNPGLEALRVGEPSWMWCRSQWLTTCSFNICLYYVLVPKYVRSLLG